MSGIRVVYMSSAARGVSVTEIEEIVVQSRQRNTELGISGMLVIHDGDIVQVLEGPEEVVDPLLERIGRDPRHVSVMTLIREPMAARIFGDWSMGLVNTRALGPDERQVVSDGLGALSGTEGHRVHKLLRRFAQSAR